MKLALIAFSTHGGALAERIMKFAPQEYQVSGYIIRRHCKETNLQPFDSVYELVKKLFDQVDGLVFISASGIAVRAIAPLIKSKLTDPAVVVCDETGNFAISLLAGHVGGANQLAEQIASLIDATPVITTASDSHLAANKIVQEQNLILGIGCRRGVSAETIERVATILLWDKKIPFTRVLEIATIDLKQDEEGLLKFAQAYNLPLFFYPAEELAMVEGKFSASQGVLERVGVDNVCERAATLRGGTGKLILGKTAKDGVTVAVFERK